MDDVNEAKELIRSIRLAKGVDESGGSNENAKDLQNALRMLSEELYSKPTHFILEFIQNADDNRYAQNVTPQLNIIYRTDGYLWIGCNEIGFTADNVRAICRIGSSTKKVEGSQKGYIGEKGIGFKSVFKVADVVWIASRALHFQFDKSKPLGMIAPIWCEFKANPLVNDRTMFCFRIPEAQHRKNVLEDLAELQPELLLFLRQLKCIDIKIQKPSGAIEKAFRLERIDDTHMGIQMTSLVRQALQPAGHTQSNKYLVCKRTAQNMPYESKRQNVSESEVIIAFPVSESFEPKPRSCLTFNFLPVRSYGLPFVLQADFMLSANREDVLENHTWNERLISTAMILFVQSVHAFNQYGLARYTWMRYLHSQGGGYCTAFAGFLDQLVDVLQTEAVIESLVSTMESPINLTYPRRAFMDNSRPPQPLISGPRGTRGYTSLAYSPKDLQILGIEQISDWEFFSRLTDYVTNEHSQFSKQPSSWHSKVSAAILKAGHTNVRGLRLIPLRTGRWSSASTETVYLPNISDGVALPSGINVDIVDDNAAKDASRCSLFQKLGVRQLNSAEVYRLIIDQHRAHGVNYGKWTVETVVAHAWFLFVSPSQPSNYDIKVLRLASKNSNTLHAGDDLYMDVPESKFRISDYFGSNNTAVHYIHDRYLTYAPADVLERWLAWLRTKFAISTILKLAKAGSISPEFQWYITSRQTHDWLLLLKAQWNDYATELRAYSNERLRSTLTQSKVTCIDGKSRAAKDVYIATSSIVEEPLFQLGVPLLAVDDPKAAVWTNFQTVGLHVRPDLRFYLSILDNVRTNEALEVSVKDVLRLYEGINRHFQDDTTLARNHFANKALVYIASPVPGKWVHLESCRWSAPECMRGIVALKARFSTLKDLFQTKLGLKDVTIEDLVQALEIVKGQSDQIGQIKDLLMALNDCMDGSRGDVRVTRTLKKLNKKILPVKGDANNLRSTLDVDWYIADTERLDTCFKDEVALLDFTRQEVEILKPLIEKLGVHGRELSKNFNEQTIASGESVFHQELTNQLHTKAPFIARLVDPSKYQAVLSRLLNTEVWRSEALKLRRHVVINGARVYGNDEDGFIVIKDAGNCIQIYVSSRMAARNRLPQKPLAEKLVPLLEVGTQREILLLTILGSDDNAEIEDGLERAGIEPAPRATVAELTVKIEEASELNDNAAVMPIAKEALEARISTVTHSRAMDIEVTLQSPASTLEEILATEPEAKYQPISLPDVEHLRSLQMNHNRTTMSHRNEIPTNTETPIRQKMPKRAETTSSMMSRPQRNGSRGKEAIDKAIPRIVAAASSYDVEEVDVAATPSSSAVPNNSTFSMSSMRSALEAVPIQANGSSFRASQRIAASLNGGSSISHIRDEANEYQQGIGYGGELFVYKWLTSKFQAGKECWTSDLRSQAGLEPFDGDESEYADFTISDIAVSKSITKWLVNSGLAWSDETPKTYHFEVKTTSGRWSEPFSISSNQISLAHGCHNSSSNVFAILRVYNVLIQPQIKTYLDPIAHEKAGTLKFTSQGGFLVEPN